MKKKNVFTITFLFVFLLVSFEIIADDPKERPVAVSPGNDTEASVVWQNCPTFSWTAVNFAAYYRVAVFGTDDAKLTSYEEMAAKTSPLLIKEIPGPALSWTLSSEESLKTGNMYAWYVQAIDAYGNAPGGWSKGRIFKVKQEAVFVGIEERLGYKLKEYGVSEEVIKNVLGDIDSEVKEVVVRNPVLQNPVENLPGTGTIKGLEGPNNTFYGLNAGLGITTGNANTFIGLNSGLSNTTGSNNSFMGSDTGYSNIGGKFNTFIGNLAGHSTNANNNTFLGYNAGYSNHSGANNTFIGTNAGFSNTVSNNTFLGYNAGYANTTGTQNLFIGLNAGLNNTSGSSNNFLGNFAGNANTMGNQNLFLGTYAGFKNTTGNFNTFLGINAGYSNTTGTQNLFIGLKAGNMNSNGSNNIFIGTNTGSANTTGTQNSFLGTAAGNKNTTGRYNSYLGYNAGYTNTTGNNNTCIGYTAGFSNTIGNSNIFLGNAAGYFETGSGKLYIANSDTTTPLIYGDFGTSILTINGSLGIGISPANPLHMASGAYCSVGGIWTDASSRSLKENIRDLSTVEALDALNQLSPVKFNYKSEKNDEHVGFIAEDVPGLVATADRKGLSPMDVTAVLTRVVQEQQKLILEQQKVNQEYKKIIYDLQERMAKIEKK